MNARLTRLRGRLDLFMVALLLMAGGYAAAAPADTAAGTHGHVVDAQVVGPHS